VPERRAADNGEMTDTVHVEAARIPDRDRLLKELQEAGLDAKPDGEVGKIGGIGHKMSAARDAGEGRLARLLPLHERECRFTPRFHAAIERYGASEAQVA